MEILPREILENILCRLPVEAALHAKRVCPTWEAILRYKTDEKQGIFFAFNNAEQCDDDTFSEDFFYEDEYDHYNTLTKIEHGKYMTKSSPRNFMVGSCNGLICFGKNHEHILGAVPFLICNPLTGESVFLPEYNYSELPRDLQIPKNPRLRCGSLAGGFGYCSSSKKYKVVTIYYYPQEQKGHVQIYTVGGEWRYIGFIDGYKIDYCSGIYANGEVYWLLRSNHLVPNYTIVAFNVEGEKFRRISLPRYKDFKMLGGNNKLYLVHTNYKSSCTDIYRRYTINDGTNHKMNPLKYHGKESKGKRKYHDKKHKRKQKYHGKSSPPWIKEFSIRCDVSSLTPFAITRNNQVLLWYKHYSPFQTQLYCYDSKTSTLNELWDDRAKGMKCWYIEAIPHRQSIVSLKDLGEKNISSLKDCEKLMLQVNSNGSREKTTTRYYSATKPTCKKVKNEGEEKPGSSRGAKRSKTC